MHPLVFFDEIVEHRGTLLSRFRQAPPEAFHQPLETEIEHHGMIRWILKRYTGWDDNQMYRAEIP